MSQTEARIAALERQVAALMRRLGTPFALGRSTTAVIDTGPVQIVQARLDALSVRDAIPVLYNYGFSSSPPVQSDLHVTFIDHDRAKSVIVASGHQTYRHTGLTTGETALYDQWGHVIKLGSTGHVVTGNVAITGNLTVTGSVIAGQGGGDQVGLQSHRHGTVGSNAAATVTPTAGT